MHDWTYVVDFLQEQGYHVLWEDYRSHKGGERLWVCKCEGGETVIQGFREQHVYLRSRKNAVEVVGADIDNACWKMLLALGYEEQAFEFGMSVLATQVRF